MARRTARNWPETAKVIRTYAELRQILAAFAQGLFTLVVILGRPGLGKSRHVRAAVQGTQAEIIGGFFTRLSFYRRLFLLRGWGLVFDDLQITPDIKDLLRDLTETDRFKRIEYGSTSNILDRDNLPEFFYTSSPVCLILNYWDSSDPVFKALESRALFFVLDLPWEEVHRDVSSWFWDQEIYDYVGSRLSQLREPDVRLYVKAWNFKRANMSTMPWRTLIDNYFDDAHGQAVRTVLGQNLPSDNQRYQPYREIVTAARIRPLARSNFFGRINSIRSFMPSGPMPQIVLTNTSPPVETPPPDGPLPSPPPPPPSPPPSPPPPVIAPAPAPTEAVGNAIPPATPDKVKPRSEKPRSRKVRI